MTGSELKRTNKIIEMIDEQIISLLEGTLLETDFITFYHLLFDLINMRCEMIRTMDTTNASTLYMYHGERKLK